MPKFELDADNVSESNVGRETAENEKPADSENPTKNIEIVNKNSATNEEADERTKFRKRKSLQQQLLNNRQYKYREYKKKMEKQNSSFKMKEDTRTYYGTLEAERKAKKLVEQLTYERELLLFRQKKEELQSKENRKMEKEGAEDEENDDYADSEFEKEPDASTRPLPAAKPSLVAYSDSDSDADAHPR